ncbi:hypothetical protein [uncultured Shewanella sp.]|uniref:hypothetical protein n=1 Tax=uncultured Shewanella sp. TaxID=173975 RepID=UPI00261B81A8|nr:hypothetical protein [uncultured Shewanella sp.]
MLTLAALATTLIQSGPALIRSIGDLFDDNTAAVANNVAELTERVTKTTHPQMELEQALKTMPSENLLKLQNIAKELDVTKARIDADKAARTLQSAETLHQQTQATVQNGDNAAGEYVRQTRPKMARFSGYSGALYIIITELCAVLDKSDGASWELASILLTPLLTYMGLRTADAFSRFKGPRL